MDENIKQIYRYLVGYNKSPRTIFRDWNKVKEVANREWKDRPYGIELYPEHIRMLMRYRNETADES